MLKYLLLIVPLLAFAQDEKRIIGKDTRIQIKAHTDYTRTVGALTRNGSGFCTATLIDPSHIITNGHCVVKNNRKFPTKLERPEIFRFVPGMLDMKTAPMGVVKVRQIHAFRQYVQRGEQTHDIALLELEKPLNVPHIRRMRVEDSTLIENRPLAVTGYSSKKAPGTMWEGRGTTRDADPNNNLVSHDVDTLPGTSGAIMRANINGKYIAIGVHRGSVGLMNNGVYFTPEVYDAIDRWIKN